MRLSLLLVPLAAYLLPATALAASATFFGPIVPEACRSCPCGFAGVMQIIQNLMNFGISLSIIIAIIIIAWGGFTYIMSSANPENRSKANKMLINAAIGLLIVLSAWLIVDFVMKSLYGGQFGPWNSILKGGDECVTARPQTPLFSGNIFAKPGQGGTNGEAGTDPGKATAGTLKQSEAAALLSQYKVQVKSGTSLEGVRSDTIVQVIALKSACGCDITVTSTTGDEHESGTYSHANGYKADVRTTTDLDTYIRTLPYIGTRSNGDPRYSDRCGNEYVRESDHWDITVNKGVCSPLKK